MKTAPRTTVVNIQRQACDVRVDRATEWGNPFHIGQHGDRAEVIRRYAAWLKEQPELLRRLPELRGKRLGCWCAPLPCHGNVLAFFADNPDANMPIIWRPRCGGPRI